MDRLFGSDIFWAFWFFLPAGIANMTPPLTNKIPWLKQWNAPLDLGGTFRGKRLLGNNKTWRGLWSGTVAASVTCFVQVNIVTRGNLTLSTAIISLIAGSILGFGALMGDVVESFFKRRVGIKSGKSWFPFDQLDYIVGGLILIYPFVRLPLVMVLWIVVIYFGLHLLVSYIGYQLGFKDTAI